MPNDIPPRWQTRLREHIRHTRGEERGNLSAFDFPSDASVRLTFPDGSSAHFRHAFHLVDEELREAAVFTEHCSHHVFPLGGLEIEVAREQWDGEDDVDG